MGTPSVVPEVESAAEEVGQGRSTIKFPYLDQDDAVEVARAIQQHFGRSCERDQLAGHFNVQANGGGFNLRMVTAKMFGLVNSEKGTLTLTPLGIRVSDPSLEKAARVESFLLVPLYKKIYDDYKGQLLPGNSGLESFIERAGVAPKQKDKARQAFQRSATQAGFFAYGANRLVLPAIKGSTGESVSGQNPQDPGIVKADSQLSNQNGSGGGGNGGDDPPHKNPFIQGLLSKLPPENTEWTSEDRKKWLQTAASIFDLVYKGAANDTSELSITLTKNSAN
jgi:hypothetical protein